MEYSLFFAELSNSQIFGTQDFSTLSKIIKNSKELWFKWVIVIKISYIRNLYIDPLQVKINNIFMRSSYIFQKYMYHCFTYKYS